MTTELRIDIQDGEAATPDLSDEPRQYASSESDPDADADADMAADMTTDANADADTDVPTWLTEAKVVLDSTDEPPDEPPDEAPDKPPDEAPDEAPDKVPDELPNEPPSKLPDELPSEPPNEPPDEPPEDLSSNPIDGIDEVAVEPVRRLDALQKAFDEFEKEIRLRMDGFEAHEAELATRIQALEPRAPPETPRARVPRDVQPSSFSALAVERARGRKLGFR